MDRILTSEEVKAAAGGLNEVTLWKLEKKGDFPKRRQISPHRVGWLASEMSEWIVSRPLSQIRAPGKAARVDR